MSHTEGCEATRLPIHVKNSGSRIWVSHPEAPVALPIIRLKTGQGSGVCPEPWPVR